MTWSVVRLKHIFNLSHESHIRFLNWHCSLTSCAHHSIFRFQDLSKFLRKGSGSSILRFQPVGGIFSAILLQKGVPSSRTYWSATFECNVVSLGMSIPKWGGVHILLGTLLWYQIILLHSLWPIFQLVLCCNHQAVWN